MKNLTVVEIEKRQKRLIMDSIENILLEVIILIMSVGAIFSYSSVMCTIVGIIGLMIGSILGFKDSKRLVDRIERYSGFRKELELN